MRIVRSRKGKEGPPLDRLRERLGHEFADPSLLEAALTHRSYANEKNLDVNYERLEFLGDAVLTLVSADWLYREQPDSSEGDLSQIKGYLVSEAVLARVAADLDLGALIQLGVGEERSGGRAKPSLLADALESVIGALYVDGGLEVARKFIEGLLAEAHSGRGEGRYRDAKSILQERLQAEKGSLPRYVVTASEGPDHQKHFTIECRLSGSLVGTGEGRSKKQAEQAAAEAALETLDAADT